MDQELCAGLSVLLFWGIGALVVRMIRSLGIVREAIPDEPGSAPILAALPPALRGHIDRIRRLHADTAQQSVLYGCMHRGGCVCTVVCVTCPSTHQRHFLCAPPMVTTCREAIAWTFGLEAQEYHPLLET